MNSVGVVAQQPRGLRAAEAVEGLALGAGLQQPVLVGLAVDGDQRLGHARPARETGTEAPPTKARERPSAETLRASTTRSSSTSPPASSTAAANAGEVADPHHALDPGGARRRSAPRRCRRGRPAAARGR